ncbi:hypothetical protein BB558_004523 [Smittium angustum]|uniref:Uncharacterized protein n=1 Tax=Smittium angustum TaxID=133377 RepID=A0A2U1J344_SMIAN|nr:hypothetical protein BB558_004523 [Smittium angustum]
MCTMFLGGRLDDSPNSERSPCSNKIRIIILKHLSKSKSAANTFPDWLRIVFESLFGEESSESLKQGGATFLKWVCQESSIEQLTSSGPVLLQGLKKLLGLNLDNSNKRVKVDIARGKDSIRMDLYSTLAILATRSPKLFQNDSSYLVQLFDILNNETQIARSNVQEAIYATGMALFKLENQDKSFEKNVFDILENTLLTSSLVPAKLTALRLLSDGPLFSNTRARFIGILGTCDIDPQTRNQAQSTLEMSMQSLGVTIPSSFNSKNTSSGNASFITNYSNTLPNVWEWIGAAYTFATTGNTSSLSKTTGTMDDTEYHHLYTQNQEDTNLQIKNQHIDTIAISNLIKFTIALLVLQGLCLISQPRNFDTLLKDHSSQVEQILGPETQLESMDAVKKLVLLDTATVDYSELLKSPIVKLGFYALLNNKLTPDVNLELLKSLYKLTILAMNSLVKTKDSDDGIHAFKHKESTLAGCSTLLQTICNLGPQTINNIILGEHDIIYDLVKNLKAIRLKSIVSGAYASIVTTSWLDIAALDPNSNFSNVDETFLKQTTTRIIELVDNIHKRVCDKPKSAITSLTFKEKECSNDLASELIFVSYSISRINAALDKSSVSAIENQEKLSQIRLSVVESRNKIYDAILVLMTRSQQLLSKKNSLTSISSEDTLILHSICIASRELFLFNSFEVKKTPTEQKSLEKQVLDPNQLLDIILSIVKGGLYNFVDLRYFIKAISGIVTGYFNDSKDTTVESISKDSFDLTVLKKLREFTLMEKVILKRFDSQIIISEIVPLILWKWDSLSSLELYCCSVYNNHSLKTLATNTAQQKNSSIWDWLMEHAIALMAKSHRATERLAAAAWIGNITLNCSSISQIQQYVVKMHRILCGLLIDKDEIVQSISGKSINLLYNITKLSSYRKEMSYSLVSIIGSRRPQTAADSGSSSSMRASANSILREQLLPSDLTDESSSTTSRTENLVAQSSNTNRNRASLTNTYNLKTPFALTYRAILDLATDVGSSELFYQLIVLAGQGIQGTISFGPPNYSSKLVHEALDQCTPYIDKLVPKLFLRCFDTSTHIAKTMNYIWTSLFNTQSPNSLYSTNPGHVNYPTCSTIIAERWDEVFEECISSMPRGDWKMRASSCATISYSLSFSNQLPITAKHLGSLWKIGFRLLDDIKDDVRVQALSMCNIMASTTLGMLDLEKNNEFESSNKIPSLTSLDNVDAITDIIFPLVLDTGLSSPAEEVRAFTISFLEKLTRHPSSKKYSGVLIIKLLESLSDMENQAMNFISQNAANWNISSNDLDSFRLGATKSSPVMTMIERSVQQLDESQMPSFTSQLCNVILHGIGLPTRAGAARLVVNLTTAHSNLILPYSLQIMKAILTVLTKSSGVESQAWASAIAFLSTHIPEKSFEKLLNRLYKTYLVDEDHESKYTSVLTLFHISKRAFGLMKHNGKILALLYLGMQDNDKKIGQMCKESWLHLTDGLTPTEIQKRYSKLIVSLAINTLESSNWAFIIQGAKTLAEIANLSLFSENVFNLLEHTSSSLNNTRGNTKSRKTDYKKYYERNLAQITDNDIEFVRNLLEAIQPLCKASLGRSWAGKEEVISSLSTVAISCQPVILSPESMQLDDSDSKTTLTDLINVFTKCIASKDIKYKRASITQFSRMMKFYNADCFDNLYPILLELIQPLDSKPGSIEDVDAPKPLLLALQASVLASIGDLLPVNNRIKYTQADKILDAVEMIVSGGVWNVKLAAINLSLLLVENITSKLDGESEQDHLELISFVLSENFSSKIQNIMNLSFLEEKYSSARLSAVKLAHLLLEFLKNENDIADHLKDTKLKIITSAKEILTRGKSDIDTNIKIESSRVLALF